jgi:hypothetical protein
MSRLLQVVSDFCTWTRMRIKREKSVATGFDFKIYPRRTFYMRGPLSPDSRPMKPLRIWV